MLVAEHPPRTDPDGPNSSIRLLPWVCDGELPYAAQCLGHARPAGSGACFAGPRSPWSPPLAPPPPPPGSRLCSVASLLLWRSQTSHDRASAATAPRLPAADHPTRGAYGQPGDL